MKIKDARSLPSVAQEDLRRKVVRAVHGGITQEEAAKLFGVSRQAISKWFQRYQKGKERALRAKGRGRPKGGSLEPWQAAQIVRAIEDRYPEQLKLPFFLWTREAVGALIGQRFGIRLSVWTVGRYLAQWGFTPQKPMRRAFEQDRERVKRWQSEEYPQIRKLARVEKALIYWGDEMGMRSDHACGRSYGRRVFLILDQHPVHKASKVSRWLRRHRDSIRVFHLPSYRPELNPDEFLNQDVKSNAVGRSRPHTQEEMVQGVRGYLRSQQRQPHLVQKYFEAESVSYAAL